MRNIKYNEAFKNKKQKSFNHNMNNKIKSFTSLDLRDINNYNSIQNKENIQFNNNLTLSFLKTNNLPSNKTIQTKNNNNKKFNQNKLKIEVYKNSNNYKISRINPTKSFNQIQFNNSINSKLNNSISAYIYNKKIKKKNLNILLDLKKNSFNNMDYSTNLSKNKNDILSHTTYNIYNLNTPIYNLINFQTTIDNKKYFSPRLINESSKLSNKNKININKINSKSSLGFSDNEVEKNLTISSSRPFSSDKTVINNKNKIKNKNNKLSYSNIYNDKINFFKSPYDHSKIANLKKGRNITNKNRINKNNNKINSIKANVTDLKKYLTLSLKNNSNITNKNKNKSKNFHPKEKSKSILSQLSNNNSISINSKNNFKYSPILEAPKIINKKVMKINSCTLAGYSSPGIQKLNQDKFFIKKDFLDEPEQFFIGVCDGHGMHGHFISEYVSKFLPLNLTNISNDEFIKSAFLKIQKSLLTENLKIDSSLSGTTCVSVILSLEKIIGINLGDSRAVLARYENGVYNAINLTRDHKLTEPDEMKRILKNGGIIKQYCDSKTKEYIGPERVFLNNSEIPGLAMSRSIGDSIAHNIGVISEPEILRLNNNGNEKFIVIASDGIWEYIDSEECVKIIKDYYENNMDAVGGLNALVKEAFKRWKNENDNVDDITAIVIFFE